MTMNHPDIRFYGSDPDAQRRRMVRDLELFLGNALRVAPQCDPLPEKRERRQEAVYSSTPATATREDLRC